MGLAGDDGNFTHLVTGGNAGDYDVPGRIRWMFDGYIGLAAEDQEHEADVLLPPE